MPGQAHDPAALEPSGSGPPDHTETGAFDNDIDVDTDVGRVAGVVVRAKPLDEVALRAPTCRSTTCISYPRWTPRRHASRPIGPAPVTSALPG